MYDLHMRGAIRRMEREADAANHHAYNTAALVGGAMAGKLPDFDRVFRPKVKHGHSQTPEVLEASFWALAKAWGAT